MNAYYLVRIVRRSPLLVECSKWFDGDTRPAEVYSVYPETSKCNCVAMKRECKHVQLAKSIANPEFIDEAFRWMWDEKNGWTELSDFPTPEELKGVFIS